ncbi:hypothetical protein M3Y94_00984300 [Aphelenchoides besseyi]|nr:hypothetical protein M3Y94_00984300 [Aphelenchoides besseyi]KAI6221087.1 Protein sidekick-like protein [Aphelenchoides besseyi]
MKRRRRVSQTVVSRSRRETSFAGTCSFIVLLFAFICSNVSADSVDSPQSDAPATREFRLIAEGPVNQSELIGKIVRMPCRVSDEARQKQQSLSLEWSKNGQRISSDGDSQRRITIDSEGSLVISQVGPDSIGTYKCLVKLGTREEAVEATLQIIEKPSMPQNIEAELLNDTLPAKIRVSWRPGFDGNSPIIKHQVDMRTLGQQSSLWLDYEKVAEKLTDGQSNEPCCSALIDNLKPSSTVAFRVIAINRFGFGRPSEPSNNITIQAQPPAAAPRDVRASGRSSHSVIVQWNPPPAENWNGEILGYNLRYRLSGYDDLDWNYQNVSNPNARNAILESLISWRDYEIQIAAYNDRGLGVYSKPIEAAPWESAPMQAPQNVQVEVINSTDIRVSFDPLDQQMIPGVNQGYKIEFWKGTPGGTLFRLVHVNPDYAVRLNQQVSDLEKFGHYNMTILCYTNAGDGPRSDPIPVITKEDVPGPVGSINFDQVQSDSVFVQWNRPTEPNGVIKHYLVRYWETTKLDGEKQRFNVSGLETNATIEGLKASTQYSVDIQALTNEGYGPRVEAKFESGVPPELPGRPTSVVVLDIGARNAVIQFVPGFDGHSYIKYWIVEAKIGSSSVFTTIYNISAPKARSFTVERLRPHTKYQLRLIAENVRGRGAPSDPTRSFETHETEPENAPEKLYAEPISDERIQVVWTPLLPTQWNAEPMGYLLRYRAARPIRLGSQHKHRNNDEELFANQDDDEWKELRTQNSKASELILLGLEPFTSYQIKLYAVNTFGMSNQSETISATTYESTPSTGPENVEVEVEQQLVRVKWDDLMAKNKRGNILGFRVRFTPEEELLRAKHTRSIDLVGADVRTAHFTKLRPFTEYRVFVAAYTIVGDGETSSPDPPTIRTPEDLPDRPSNVRFNKISPHSVNLMWESPIEPNGRITSYGIRYWRSDQSETQAIATHVKHNLYEFSANSLTPNSTYVFAIKAETAVGWGHEVEVSVFTSTARSQLPSPVAPDRNAMRAPSANGVWLRWSPPSRRPSASEAPVRGIEIDYHRTNEPWKLWPSTISADRNEVFLDDLLPNQKYQARLRYISDFDRSVWSVESPWIETLEATPTKPPSNVDARPYESSSILVKWDALDPLLWNSNAIGYRVLYRIYPSNDSFMVDEIPLMESNPTNGKLEHIVKKLSSFHHYLVQLQSFNSLGASPVSTPPSFVYVGYSIPKQEIRNLVANSNSSTTIYVRWDDWSQSNDDVISGYRIRYAPVLSTLSPEIKAELEGGESTEEVVVTEKNEIVLSDLRKFTEYQILVCGYNRAGNGQASKIRTSTLEDLPGPVGQLVFKDILLDSVNVSWSPPTQPNGQITGYLITYRTYRMREEWRKEIQDRTPVNFLLANELVENTTYEFSVQALTAVGAGPEVRSNVTIGYNLGAPSSPTQPLVKPEEMTFMIKWKDGSPGDLPIKGHLIQAKRIAVVAQNQSDYELNAEKDDEDLQAATQRFRRNLDYDPYAPRHPIGEWQTITHTLGQHNEYRVSYRQLMPASFYVFRIFALNDIGIGMPSSESERLQVPATLPDDPFYTKWWFLVIVGLVILMVVIVFVATLCVTSATSWKKEEKTSAYHAHQLADGFVVSYELQSKQRGEESATTPRPATHTSWLSNDGLASGRLGGSTMPIDPTYGSIGSGLNQNGGNQSARSIYGSSSVYQQLATDQIPPEAQRLAGRNLNGSIASGVGGYASTHYSKRPVTSNANTRDYWSKEEDDYATERQTANGLVDLLPPVNHHLMNDNDEPNGPDLQAEHSFASHYQSTNPHEESYRATWRRTREQVERSRAPSRNVTAGYAAVGLSQQVPYGYPNRPDSSSTNESPPLNGSDHGIAPGSSSTQSAKSTHGPGIQLRSSTEFDSPKLHPNAPFNIGNSVQHGYSSFV